MEQRKEARPRPSRVESVIEKVASKMMRAMEIFTRILGPMLILLAIVLISMVTYTYFDGIAPALGLQPFSLSWIVVTAFGIWILANLLFNYGASILVAPGQPKDRVKQLRVETVDIQDVPEAGQELQSGAVPRLRGGPAFAAGVGDLEAGGEPRERSLPEDEDEMLLRDPNHMKFCKKCNCDKPARTHHCHVCGRCVLKMDHHCPWLGSCVGLNNYAYFVKMLFWFWFGCIFIAMLTASPFATTFAAANPQATTSAFDTNVRITLCFIICIAIGFAISLLFAWHIYLVSTNQTSIEYLQNSSTKTLLKHRGLVFKNPFDLGVRRNWIAVFGPAPWYTHLLPRFTPPASDGWSFDTNR